MTNILLDGLLSDWSSTQRIDGGAVTGYQIYATTDATDYIFALSAPTAVGPNTTIWLNTDLNTSTGYQVFGFAGGAEFNVNFKADGTAALYSGADGQTLVADNLAMARSADGTVVELRVSKAAIGSPAAIDTLYDINNSPFIPTSYAGNSIRIWDDSAVSSITPGTDTKIAIVYSETTAANYFNKTAYSQLFMSAQSQAMQAGVSFDLLNESDLTDIAKLAQYKAIVFPSFRNVQSSQVDAIAHALQVASQQFHVGLVVSGEFMTDDQNNNALPGNSYARMASLLDATRVTGGFPADVTIHATDPTGLVLDGYANGEVVNQYTGVGWNAFQSVSGTGKTIATETINGTTDYAAVLATQTGGRNVLFSSDGVMADANMLQKAIDYVVNGNNVSVSLHMTRETGLVAARVDMDQSMYPSAVSPTDGTLGVYDQLMPLLAGWKQQYNFVGSYYLNIGNDPKNGETTDWAKSLPYYTALVNMGNELGTHSYTHPFDTNTLTASQMAFEFGDSTTVLQQQLSAALGYNYQITGAAVPGAPETVDTALAIEQYVTTYLSGGYSGQGAGYPNAFGYLTPGSEGKVYLAPNTYFDFTLFEWLKLNPTQASAMLASQYDKISAHGDTPIVVWPWHDYGATGFQVTGYSTQLWNDFISKAAADGREFVTLGDLANRINAFDAATVTTSVSGNVVTATVTASNVGQFAFDLKGQGSQIIQNVAGWYAYDADSVFLPKAGGTFTITLGAAQDDVSHIIDLPMRATLVTLTGDGHNLNFTVEGEGRIVIDLADPTGKAVNVTGATVISQVGDKLTVDLGPIGSHTVSVTEAAVSAAPVITSNGGGDTAAISVAENTTAVTTVTSTDADGPAATYSISGGADAASFTIDAVTGALAFVSGPNFEAPADAGTNNVYDVIVTVSDGALTDSQALAVSVTNVNEAPVITSNGGTDTAAVSIGENTTAVTTVTSTDPEGTPGIYSISGGADADKFVIDAASGALSFVNAPNFEAPTDAGANNVYDVIVTASDGTLIDTQALAVTVTNVNEAPIITSNGGGATAAVSVAENTTAVTTVTSTDPEGTALAYSISGGADAGRFNINATTGALSFKSAPNFEAPADAGANNVYDVIVTASDGSLTDTQAIAVTVTNGNEAPIITSNGGGASASLSVAENTTAVTTVTSTDPEGTARTYSLSGTDAALFAIDAATGALRFIAAPDYEAPADSGANNVYNLTVTASDGSLVDNQALTVTVTNRGGVTLSASNTGSTLTGTIEEDFLYGGKGADTIFGLGGNDRLEGAGSNDTLYGGDGNDLLIGGAGRDTMYGGAGSDTFRFNALSDSVVGLNHDVIADFNPAFDRIDLSGIDARSGRGGNQSFTFLQGEGTPFTAAGQVHYFYDALTNQTIVQANVDGNLAADFEIALTGHIDLGAGSAFIL
ncbi:cadherin [Novosphingobium sp. KCTC 2891]|uniref:cadherin n=1 Tax=Novosphingobium sp. KCTC 2891 TaxID=2989730 RepID=UPI00222366DF|nr:cadherin [Novosphingobium sp. KCTC 2891]MCW1381903.1 cadherin [Novosphingobium sp. KCTC 2891]